MKKLALALVCLVSVAFFASCDPKVENPEPSIAVITGTEYITGTIDNPQVINLEDETPNKYGFHVESNAETNKALANLKVHYAVAYGYGEETYNVEYDSVIDLTGKTSYDFIEGVFTDEKTIIFSLAVTATVTDEAGEVNSASIAFKVDYVDTLEEMPFEWRRDNGGNGTGLEEFGLKWEVNVKDRTVAKIVPLEGAVMTVFDPEDWTNTTTELQKYALFSEISLGVAEFKEVSTTASADYDLVIGTIYDEEFFLIHITHCDVYERGWHFVITGDWK